jgi:endonuclease/exonuclease/phosphatase family metal-dependent hydrolase
MSPVARTLRALTLAAATAGCASAANYTDPDGPRYGVAPTAAPSRDTVHVVAFNVKYANHVERTIALLTEDSALRGADVVLLQEMDEPGTRRIAEALGLGYVYYPATRHPRTGRDFGNAILTRWPIEDDRKIVLPHLGRFGATQRAAVAATLRIGTQAVRVYSVHLATMTANGPGARRDQIRAVLDDADRYDVAILGGDFNSETVPEVALTRGFTWPTRGLPRTSILWTFDHILLKGLAPAGPTALGVVPEVRGASDHRPVWMRVPLVRVPAPVGAPADSQPADGGPMAYRTPGSPAILLSSRMNTTVVMGYQARPRRKAV